jgi:triacylglycerol lipase
MSEEWVVLLHGLNRTKRSMVPIESALAAEGYRVLNVDYPSRRRRIEEIADNDLDPALRTIPAGSPSKMHFVTHSLGGIVVRYYFKHHPSARFGRVVMLSPPNQGSELVDRLKDAILFRLTQGPAAQQLRASANEFLERLGAVEFELGVITGSANFDPLAAWLIPGPSDGKVSVERAKIAGMRDFLVLPYSHTFIMRRPAAIEQIIHFLRHGAFRHRPSSPEGTDS